MNTIRPVLNEVVNSLRGTRFFRVFSRYFCRSFWLAFVPQSVREIEEDMGKDCPFNNILRTIITHIDQN